MVLARGACLVLHVHDNGSRAGSGQTAHKPSVAIRGFAHNNALDNSLEFDVCRHHYSIIGFYTLFSKQPLSGLSLVIRKYFDCSSAPIHTGGIK